MLIMIRIMIFGILIFTGASGRWMTYAGRDFDATYGVDNAFLLR